MKKTILWSIIFLFIVALIPMVSGIKGIELTNLPAEKAKKTTSEEKTTATSDENSKTDELTDLEMEIIVCKVMEHITEDAHLETKKAILAVCKNNYLYLKEQGESDFESEISKYSDSFLEELYSLYNENEFLISYNNELVPIPLITQNGGFTATSDEFPYIEPTASPWDAFSEGFIRGAEYSCGVSIYGIGYLCENGMSWKEALGWYLPNFTIG